MKPIKGLRSIVLGISLAALPLAVRAQTTGDASVATSPASYGPHQGSQEFSLSGSGASNKQLNDSLGGAAFSYGDFIFDSTEVLIRQTFAYTNPATPGVGSRWNGTTKLALDQLLCGPGRLRPFVGANLGYIYGQTVNHTWAAGLEAGLRYYVLPRTFLFAETEYDWFFRHIHNIGNSNHFNQGQVNWSLGMGFNF
jgi:hypothetical protein